LKADSLLFTAFIDLVHILIIAGIVELSPRILDQSSCVDGGSGFVPSDYLELLIPDPDWFPQCLLHIPAFDHLVPRVLIETLRLVLGLVVWLDVTIPGVLESDFSPCRDSWLVQVLPLQLWHFLLHYPPVLLHFI
jgi:hypothetical protein